MLYYIWQVEILTMTNLQTKCSFTYPEKNWPIFMGNLKLQILCGSVLCKRIILVNKVKLLTIWRLNVRQIRLIIQIYLKEAYRLVFQIFTGSIIDYKCGECLPEPNPSKTYLNVTFLPGTVESRLLWPSEPPCLISKSSKWCNLNIFRVLRYDLE